MGIPARQAQSGMGCTGEVQQGRGSTGVDNSGAGMDPRALFEAQICPPASSPDLLLLEVSMAKCRQSEGTLQHELCSVRSEITV